MLSFILNLPYTFIGIFLMLFLQPVKVEWNTHPYRITCTVKNDSFGPSYTKGWRGMTVGHVILLNPRIEENDIEHEIIHVRQYERLLLIFPFLYYWEMFKHGYRNNKYEEEAYSGAGNRYGDGKVKTVLHTMKLQPLPFSQIKNGTKTIEIRLKDEKRQFLEIGDKIEFTSAEDQDQKTLMEIVGLITYPSFKELFFAYPPAQYGGESSNEWSSMYKYYSPEDEAKYGVLAIKLKSLNKSVS